MPTPIGLMTLLLALLGGTASWIWGLPAVFLASAVGAALLLLSLAAVHFPLRVDVERSMTPARAHLGTQVLVTLEFRILRKLFGRSVELQEYVPSERSPILNLGWVSERELKPLTYYIEARKRGFLEAGPLRLITTDPFDLARRTKLAGGAAAEVSRILVWPYFVDVSLPGAASENSGASHNQIVKQVPASEEEFVGLREYTVGDDPRRIHWPSSARHRELMVRQLEHDTEEEAVVYLETDSGAATPETFEEMVSAAASLAVACCGYFHRTTLLTRTGSVSVIRGGLKTANPSAILDSLALIAQQAVEPFEEDRYPVSNGATLFAVLGELTLRAHAVWSHPALSARKRFVAQFSEGEALPTGQGTVTIRPGERFTERWEAALDTPAPEASLRRG